MPNYYVVASVTSTVVSGIVNGKISSETRPKNAYVNYIIKE